MNQDELLERLLATFAGELDEHVRSLNASLLALERNTENEARDQHVRELFRAAHSLKGAARSVGVKVVEAACHCLEELFGALRDGTAELASDAYQLLFSAVDAIDDAGQRLREGEKLDDSPLAMLVPQLEGVARTGVRPPPAPRSASGIERRSGAAAAVGEAAKAGPEAAAGNPAKRAETRERSVRVSADKLDTLMSWSGELLVARQRLAARQLDVDKLYEQVERRLDDWRKLQRMLQPANFGKGMNGDRFRERLDAVGHSLERIGRQAEALKSAFRADFLAIEQAAAPLDDSVRGARMLPFTIACEGLDRMVRDLTRTQGKAAALAIEGGDVELDREVLDRLRDPLLHLVRNAVDHGVEPPADRRAAGKPEAATIRVMASLRGGRVQIVVEDDGRGLDVAAVRERALALNVAVPRDEDGLARLVFLPGFSTARQVTEVSGRGIGLDVVKSAIEAQRGSVNVSFAPGRGMRFVLSLPLTLSVLRALLVRDADETFAFDDASIASLRRIKADDVRSVEGRQVLSVDGAHLPLVGLGAVLGRAEGKPIRPGESRSVVVLESDGRRAAFAVDELLTERDLTVKPLGPRLAGVRHVTGGTVLADGNVTLILNAQTLVEDALAASTGAALAAVPPPEDGRRARLLLAEDSVTVRALEKSILEAAGYDVVAVVDGFEAWQLLQEFEADLVVSDVQMPRMDGITLTEKIRASSRLRALPVVLVTALNEETDRMRGLEAGANAYLVKSGFDQSMLLETIERLI